VIVTSPPRATLRPSSLPAASVGAGVDATEASVREWIQAGAADALGPQRQAQVLAASMRHPMHVVIACSSKLESASW